MTERKTLRWISGRNGSKPYCRLHIAEPGYEAKVRLFDAHNGGSAMTVHFTTLLLVDQQDFYKRIRSEIISMLNGHVSIGARPDTFPKSDNPITVQIADNCLYTFGTDGSVTRTLKFRRHFKTKNTASPPSIRFVFKFVNKIRNGEL